MSNGITAQTTSIPWTTGVITIWIIIVSGLISAAGNLRSPTGATAGEDASLEVPSSVTSAALAPDSGPVPQEYPTPWADSNVPGSSSPVGAHSPLPPGAAAPIHPGSGAALMVGAAGTILAGGGATLTTTAAGNGDGDNIAQPHDHVETTDPSSTQGPFGHMDPIVLFLHFQSISSSGLLSLRYPPIYQAFTVGAVVIGRFCTKYIHYQVNFAWANFILPIRGLKKAAANFRHCTLPDSQSNPSGSGVSSLTLPSVSYGPSSQLGIAAYAARLGIPSQDIFGIIYLVYLCACGVLLALFFVVGLALQIAVWHSSQERKGSWRARRFRWAEMASNNSLRIMVLALGTLATFTFYVSHIRDHFMSLELYLSLSNGLSTALPVLPSSFRHPHWPSFY